MNPYASAIAYDHVWTTSYNGTSGSTNLLRTQLVNGTTRYRTCTGTNYASGSGVAVDSLDDVWVSESATGYLIEFSDACSYETSYNIAGRNGAGLVGVTMDGNSNIWTLTSANYLFGLTTGGTSLVGSKGLFTGGAGTQLGPAVDGSGNVWYSNSSANTVSETIGVAAPVITPLSAALLAGTIAAKP